MVDVKESLGLKNTGCGSDRPLWPKQTFASGVCIWGLRGDGEKGLKAYSPDLLRSPGIITPTTTTTQVGMV